MPRRLDLESICLIGSGPIVIGQACEFDYAGCQALKVLREDGFRKLAREVERRLTAHRRQECIGTLARQDVGHAVEI